MSQDKPPAASQSWKRLLWRIVRIPLIAYVCVSIGMMFLENSLIFFPSVYPEGNWQPAGLEFEDAQFVAADGTRLHGWYAAVENPRAVVLFCHGNAGNVTHRVGRQIRWQQRFRISSLVFDYRGYGRSEGSPNEAGIIQDARAARAWLAKKTGLPEARIVLAGESLGAGVAVDLAANDGAAGLILESTFTSLPDVAARHYPWAPVKLFMRTRLDSLSKIRKYRGPLLWSHGDADEIVPYELGKRLFEAANEPKQGITFPGGEHNPPPYPEDRTEYGEALLKFLEQVAQH